MKPTIMDVAVKAGVSKSTASRVLNNSGYVSEEARKKVLKAAKSISYSANYFARGLKGKNPGIIGLINKNQLHPFFSIVSHGIEEEARKKNLGVITVCSEEDSRMERKAIDLLLDRNIRQLIFATPTDVSNIKYAQKNGAHCVIIERDLGYSHVDRVLYDNKAAGAMIANILLDKGYANIGYIGIDVNIGSIEYDRYHGFFSQLNQKGVPLGEQFDIHNCSEYTREQGYYACEQMFKDTTAFPRALMVGSDFLLVGVMEFLHRNNLSVPDDVALISADNFYTDILYPSIDSIDYSVAEMGREAIMLFQEDGERERRNVKTVVIEPTYVRRSSLG